MSKNIKETISSTKDGEKKFTFKKIIKNRAVIVILTFFISGMIFSSGNETADVSKLNEYKDKITELEETNKELQAKIDEINSKEEAVVQANTEVETEEVQQEEKETVQEQPQEETVEMTLSQKNAVKTAKSYLDYSGFSRQGLIEQLEFEGYSTEDSTYAVDNSGANWNEECAETAQNYLDYSSFSRDGLYEQLQFEGFTDEQINYGLSAVGY